MHVAFEDQLVQKVMPKLRGIDTRGKSKDDCLDKIRSQLLTGIDGNVLQPHRRLRPRHGTRLRPVYLAVRELPQGRKTLMNLREVYRAYGEGSETGALARQLLEQQHWYSSIAEFDPKTGDALPLGFDAVLHHQARLHPQANGAETTCVRDRLWRIVDHSRASVERIFGSLSESPRREQAILPIRDVKELNATSFIALSRRPGRNVREKLAGRPYMQAVRRYQSADLPQNRLVKEFVTQLAERLELRKMYLGHEDELLGTIYRWLRSDEAQAISRWDNLPPNNTLLSHRDYRRVWDAWRWLQALDDAIDGDHEQLEARQAMVEEWTGYGEAYSSAEDALRRHAGLLRLRPLHHHPVARPHSQVCPVRRPDRRRQRTGICFRLC